MENRLNIILPLIVLWLISSCNNTQKSKSNEIESSLKSVVEDCLGEELIVPDSLITYIPLSGYLADSAEMLNANMKIYTHINASCATCVKNIKLWNNFIRILKKYDVPVIIICDSKDNFELIQYIYESGDIKELLYPLLFDPKKQYTKKNSFMKESPHFETVLTDRSNNILLLGNPIHSKEIENMYLEFIWEKSSL